MYFLHIGPSVKRNNYHQLFIQLKIKHDTHHGRQSGFERLTGFLTLVAAAAGVSDGIQKLGSSLVFSPFMLEIDLSEEEEAFA